MSIQIKPLTNFDGPLSQLAKTIHELIQLHGEDQRVWIAAYDGEYPESPEAQVHLADESDGM
jgi:hypothetical protein